MPKRFVNALIELNERLSLIESKLGIDSVPTITFEGSEEEARAAIEFLKKMGVSVVSDLDVITDEEPEETPEQESAAPESEPDAVPNSDMEKEFNTPLGSLEDQYGPYIVRYRLPNGYILVWQRTKVTEYNKTGFKIAVYDGNENRTDYIPIQEAG